jgi:predicted DNA binding protein
MVKKMRKITLEVNISTLKDIPPMDIISSFLSIIDRVEAKSFLKIDMLKGEKIVIAEFTMKPGHVLEDIPFPTFAKILNVISCHENKYLVIIQAQYEPSLASVYSAFGIDQIFYETPAYLDNDRLVFSILGEKDALSSFLKLVKKTVGDPTILRVQDHTFRDESLLSGLTERQKEILIKAKQLGYYEIPRKISSLDLAKEFNISKSAVLEHLRKAEGKIMVRVIH